MFKTAYYVILQYDEITANNINRDLQDLGSYQLWLYEHIVPAYLIVEPFLLAD